MGIKKLLGEKTGFNIAKCLFIFITIPIFPLYNSFASAEPYKTETKIDCDSIELKVITHCLENTQLSPACISSEQHFIFKDKKNGTEIKKQSSSPKFKGSQYVFLEEYKNIIGDKPILQYLATSIACFKGKEDHYLEVGYYRGGNCDQCEYSELYDFKGNIIATDKGKLQYHWKEKEKISGSYYMFEKKMKELDLTIENEVHIKQKRKQGK